MSGVILFLGLFVYRDYFFTFDSLKGESYLIPVTSPTMKYTANAYYMPYGGAAGGVKIWVDVTYHDENDKIQTVYYSEAKSGFSMSWNDEDILYIKNENSEVPNSSRSIMLEIGKEIYHEYGLACKSWLMQDEYETCYQYE
ncbi:DUF5412 family protein [Bacillus sp. SCS-151]|uniref:DUF5412 family protein n=1 Tax=Nanhaiella sioensis TaxID=3115293 RepID=UPI003979F187